MAQDNAAMPNSPLFLDVKQVRCTLKDVLHLAEQISYDRSMVTLSDAPGKEYFGNHKDRYMQLPVCVMIGNEITWSLMISILLNTKWTGSSSMRTHMVRKFQVPECIVELLKGLPFVVGFGDRGHVKPNGWTGLEALRFR